MTEEKTATEGATNENIQGQAEEVRMTTEELEKRLQSETDKRVTEALKTHRTNWERETNSKIAKAQEEAERLAKMSADEREKEIMAKTKAELEQKEKMLTNRELKIAAIDMLTEEKLPITFADQLLGETAEDTHDRIKKFKKAWTEAVDEEVKTRLKGVTPAGGAKAKDVVSMNDIIRQKSRR